MSSPSKTRERPARPPTPLPVRATEPKPERVAAPGGAGPTAAGILTSVRIPAQVMDRVQKRLDKEPTHNMRSLILLALSRIDIEVEPEFLVPIRKRPR
jgi:hypothetical protein